MEKSLIGTFPARNWSFPILPISRLPWARQKKKTLVSENEDDEKNPPPGGRKFIFEYSE